MILTYFYPILAEMAGRGEIDQERAKVCLRILADLSFYASGIWAGLIVLAGALTVVFTLASRRATIRQNQASLDEVLTEIRKGPRLSER